VSVKEVTYHQVECDGCSAGAHEDGEFSAYYDSGHAIEDASANDWMTEVGTLRLDFCPSCSKRRSEELFCNCDHDEMSKIGDLWVCDSCDLELGKPVRAEVSS
jgi:hypothetical protein